MRNSPCCLFAIVLSGAGTCAVGQDGLLSGLVRDAAERPVAGAVVVVCDHATGIPVTQGSFRPFVENMQIRDIAFAMTGPDGAFVIRDVKPGVYRLLAQSWPDAEKPIERVLDVHGRVVQLHGIAARVEVPSAEAERISIRPLGTAVFDITTAPQAPNDETLLVVSSEALVADPILGFAAWSGPFMPNMLVANRMPHGKTTLRGLPAGTCHVAAFAADNNPGFGGIDCQAVAGHTTVVTLPLIASWSDGHKQPPARLQELVQRFQAADAPDLRELLRQRAPDAARALEAAREASRNAWSSVIPVLELRVEFEPGQRVAIKDLLAAEAYAQLLRQDQQRRDRMKQDQLQQMKVDPGVTYQQALEDLHARLGREYPCFELKGIDWQAVGERLLSNVNDVRNDEQFGLLCLEMVAALQDSHAQVLPAAAQLPSVPFPAWDAGFACLEDDRGEPVVYHVAPNSSAAAAGLRVGMTIKTLNGVAAQQGIKQTMQQLSKYAGYSSERYLRYHAYHFFTRQMVRGQSIELFVADPQGKEMTLSMQAAEPAGYVPRLPVPIAGIPDSGDVSWKMLDGDIGYLYVRRIKPDLIECLDRAIKELRDARGLIIDVRGNSGGGFDAARSFRNFDLEDGAEPSRPRFTKRIALLVDARCISAGEGWSSWFVARQRARLFGQATAGASARKTTYQLRNGLFSVRYPVKAYQGFLDRPIERRGLEPDVIVMPNVHDLANGRDTVLEAARNWLLAGEDSSDN